jgi:hypothetical protein
MGMSYRIGMVLGFEQDFSLEDAIGSHAFPPLEANMRVTNSIPLGSPLSYRLSSYLGRNTEGDRSP